MKSNLFFDTYLTYMKNIVFHSFGPQGPPGSPGPPQATEGPNTVPLFSLSRGLFARAGWHPGSESNRRRGIPAVGWHPSSGAQGTLFNGGPYVIEL